MSSASRWFLVLAFALVLALHAGRLAVHICDGDGQLYRVVARNIVERGQWIDLTYLPRVHPVFREHLPFGVWPTAAFIAVFGNEAVPYAGWIWSVCILVAVALAARELWSEWEAAAAVLILGTTDAFTMHCGFPRLDGPNNLFAFLAIVPWLKRMPDRRGLAISLCAAAVACAIKGPFGLVPVASVALARSLVTRSVRPVLVGAALTMIAALPVLLFLLSNRSWWEGFVGAQLLDSASGVRTDGDPRLYFPLIALFRHFWPGLALLPLVLWRLRSAPDPRRTLLGLAFVIGLVVLCLPTRKLVHHVGVLYPLGALIAGEALAVGFKRLASTRHERTSRAAAASLAVVAWLLVISGHPFWVRSNGCLPQSALGAALRKLPEGTELAVISARPKWREVAALAAELHLRGSAEQTWADVTRLQPAVRVVLFDEGQGEQAPAGWSQLAAAEGWALFTADSPP